MGDELCHKYEILIVDDSPEQIHIISSLLKKSDYKVRALTDSKETFDLLESINFDLILLDILMPEINGIELCKLIKNDRRFSAIPIIFLTAISEGDMIAEAFSAGAHDYVSKPVNPKELLARVNLHLQLKCKTEKLEMAYKEIESFNHMVCHDLKSPLWAIKSLVGFLNDEYLKNVENEGKHFLQRLSEKATEAIQLIEKLSELSRFSSEPLTKEKLNIKDIVNEVTETLLKENKKRNIELTVSEFPEISGDKLLIRQVFYNILSNSFKYTALRNSARISVSWTLKGNEYIFCIEDNGAGFNMSHSSRLFQMFQRMHTKKDFEGTGTGLAITKKIIERHFGRIWAESEEGVGTKVFFTLPK